MPIPLAPIPLLIGLGLALGLILAVFLWGRPRGNRQSNRLLAGFVISYALSNLGAISWPAAAPLSHPAPLDAFMPLFFLIGPFLYFYVRSRIEGGIELRPAQAVHLLAFFLAAIGYAVLFVRAEAEGIRSKIPHAAVPAEPWWVTAYLGIRVLFIVFYALLALRSIRRAGADSGAGAGLGSAAATGLKALIIGYGSAALAGLISVRFGLRLDLPIHLWMTIMILLLGLRGAAKPGPDIAAGRPRGKYGKSALPVDQAERIERLIVALMENDRLYLEADLSLTELAGKSGLSAGSISQVINTRLGRSFWEFLNGYRVEEARRLLRDPRRREQKILAIALDSGFNSKVVFNRVFKKHTGMTPSDFRRRGDDSAAPRA